MLIDGILGRLLESPEPKINIVRLSQRLDTEQSIVRHHLYLLQDKGWVVELESGFWRLTNAGHDYLEGTP